MKKARLLIQARVLRILASLAILMMPAGAQVPQIINYQGKISVGATPFTGTGQFKFAMVNGDATTSFWSNDGTSAAGSESTSAVSLPVVNGLYLVPLGDTAIPNMQAVPATVFTNSDVRLRVWFNDGTNGSQLLTPDQRITSVGYAMVAGSVPDGAIGVAQLTPAARPKHDRQMAAITASNPSLPGTSTYVDVSGLALTTKNLGESGTYRVSFSSSIRVFGVSDNYFVINVDGNDVEASRMVINSTGGYFTPVTCSALVAGIDSGKVIKLRYYGGGPILYRPSLVIDGVPSSQVVP